MIDTILAIPAPWLWLALAAILAIAEIAITPGIFLIFVAMAAGATGIVTWVLPLSFSLQLGLFGIFSLISVYSGRNWYRRNDRPNADPMLNDRAARMVGKNVTVVEDVSMTSGRVRVGDGEWPARGPDLKKGQTARINAVEGGIVMLEIPD